MFAVRKQVFGPSWVEGYPSVLDHYYSCVEKGVYDREILDKYTYEEWTKINSWMDHERDMLFTYAGLRQVVDKYLVQDRSCGEMYETPQYMYDDCRHSLPKLSKGNETGICPTILQRNQQG